MRIERICVRRLKSFTDYSNVAVEICASLDEGEDIETVYAELLQQANIMIAKTRLIEESEEIREHIEKLREVLHQLEEQKQELIQAIEDAKMLLEKTRGIRFRILGMLRR